MADKNVLPKNKELYKARKVFDNEWAYGMAVLPINDNNHDHPLSRWFKEFAPRRGLKQKTLPCG